MSVKTTREDLIRPLMRSNIKAKDIVRALTQQDNGPERLILRHKKIRGKLDLKDRLITIPLTLRNCEFLGAVDLRNCEFKQAIDFTRCVFHEVFNSGDEYGSHTVYKRDVICNEAVFKSSVSFDGSHFEGVASFSKAVFESKEKKVSFRRTPFEDSLRCDATTFKGAADFQFLKLRRPWRPKSVPSPALRSTSLSIAASVVPSAFASLSP
jgi:hypothetical protein